MKYVDSGIVGGEMINRNTRFELGNTSKAVEIAIDALKRDILNTCLETDREGTRVRLIKDADIEKECFELSCVTDGLLLSASDELGFIYGVFHISKYFLGVGEFWFWNEQRFNKREYYNVPKDYHYVSKPSKVKYRGWFINDEVLFDGWRARVGDNFPWEMAFEALLRCGGNMIIPGTDYNAHKYKQLAVDYGLWITHHHAEPMGARMFARAYPDLEASFDRNPELFRGLWKEALEEQKGMNVIWNIGFRGQGDRPFWVDDPAYDTPQTRGKLMSDLMLEQYDMIKKQDKNAVCCVNLYGEIMELYKDGFLAIPGDVIKIWADNGFGKMVSRRQNNHNPRVVALPEKEDKSAHGIYYHASFYDLQAAAMMTMLPNSPAFVIRELSEVLNRGMNDFWIINCSNVKPHTYYLDLIARLWRGELEPSLLIDASDKISDKYTNDYCRMYYETDESKIIEAIAELYRLWPEYAVKYGINEDDHAGEQFSNHGARILTYAFMSGFDRIHPDKTKKTPELNWLIEADTLFDQVNWLLEKYEDAVKKYGEYLQKCEDVRKKLENEGIHPEQLKNNLINQVEYLYYSYLGAFHICKALIICLNNSAKGEQFVDALEETGEGPAIDYLSAFYEAGVAESSFAKGYETMRSHEHDVFVDFYKNDCEADIKQSAYVATSLMSYLRMLGDGPHFYKWQRHFQEGAGGDKVHLVLRIKEHLTDKEIWNLMT